VSGDDIGISKSFPSPPVVKSFVQDGSCLDKGFNICSHERFRIPFVGLIEYSCILAKIFDHMGKN
jgi:hypothetical protein